MKLAYFGNETYEDEQALVDLDNGEIILSGDHYHDKISHRIEGYLYALKKHDIYVNNVWLEWITPDHEYFEKCNFYNNDEGYEDLD